MLKTNYNSESEIPENLKGAYVQRDGKWLLDDLSDDHPVIVSKKAALADKSRAVTKQEELQADLEAAKQNHVPRGHVAVPKADQELLEKVKPFGSGDEVISKLTEHKSLKEESSKRSREDSLRAVAKELNYEPEAFVRLQGLPEFEIRDKDGKKTVIAKVKTGDTITEKPASEFIESSADFAPFVPALKAAGGTRVHGSRGDGGAPPKDAFQKIRDEAKKKKSDSTVHPMFSRIPGRVNASAGE